MARKNRLVVNDSVYHITTRIANRAFLFRDDELKDRIVEWMYGVADFSGVSLLAWCVMENHIHVMVRVPDVPERYWLDGACPPSPADFTLRPSECFPSRRVEDAGDCVRTRPPVGFMLPDAEMLGRLASLYGASAAAARGRAWERLRAAGRGAEVDAEKERYCRRMYNVSQFAKTLKERIAMRYNDGSWRGGEPAGRHFGHLFEGRFRSVIVEKTKKGYGAVASYIGVNPVKARIADAFDGWRWSSFACAVRGVGERAERCRRAYAEMFGCSWDEAKGLMERLMSDRLPEGFDPERDGFSYETVGEDGKARREPLRVTQAIWLKVKAFTQGAVVTRDPAFARAVFDAHPRRFPHDGDWSVAFCRRLRWTHAA